MDGSINFGQRQEERKTYTHHLRVPPPTLKGADSADYNMKAVKHFWIGRWFLQWSDIDLGGRVQTDTVPFAAGTSLDDLS